MDAEGDEMVERAVESDAKTVAKPRDSDGVEGGGTSARPTEAQTSILPPFPPRGKYVGANTKERK